MTAKKRVLILCTGNSARSQMAEGLLRALAGDRFDVYSAGTIATYVRPQAIEALAEIGIDISGHRSKSQDEFAGQPFDYVITVCDSAREHCPLFPGPAKRIHWSIDDPAFAGRNEAERLEAFRRARNELKARLEDFAKT
jgi:arsenate reductase (thioredoxin)